MASSETNLCRLCFSSQNHLLDIFDNADMSMIEIINKHIGEVSETDALPNWCCAGCWERIVEFHQFHRSVHSAQKKYLERFIKFEEENDAETNHLQTFSEFTEQTNFVEVASNYDELMEFVDEFPIKADESDETDVNAVKLEEIDLASHQLAESSTSVEIDTAKRKEIIENFDTTCDICSIDLKTLNYSLAHYKKEHKTDGYIKCCGIRLKNNKSVDDHIKYHNNPEFFKCKYCDRSMKTRLSLSTHIAKHKHAKTYTCDYCGKTFKCISRIRCHVKRHINNWSCDICSKSCSTKEELNSHLKICHNPDEARRQWDELCEAKKNVEPADVEQMIAKHFDMKCQYCEVEFKSLQEAQFHYLDQHQIPDGYIQCCELKFKTTPKIEGHVLKHLMPDLFICRVCNRDSKIGTVNSMRSHLLRHEVKSAEKQHVCTECNKSYYAKQQLIFHLKSTHGIVPETKQRDKPDTLNSDPDIYKTIFDMKCDIEDCQTEMSSLQHAKLHYLEQHGIKHGYIKCCDIKFKKLTDVSDHVKYHINPNIYTCEICMKVFVRKYDLSTHISKHKAYMSKRFTCDKCGKSWRSNYELNVHKRSHEEKLGKPFPCDYCNRKFKTEELRRSHISRIHERNKKEVPKTEICEYCAKTFSTRKDVLAHINNIHTENTVRREGAQCQICNAWLSNRYSLKGHMHRHNSEPKKCPQCDKISPNQQALVCHIRAVHCPRIFRCHLCSKTFKEASSLKDHIATHTGEKTYKCSYCPESFIWRPNMYSHQKKAHPEEWKKEKNERQKRYTKN